MRFLSLALLMLSSTLGAVDAPAVVPHSDVSVDQAKVGQQGQIHLAILTTNHVVPFVAPAGLKVLQDVDTDVDVMSDGTPIQFHTIVIECEVTGKYDVHFDVADQTGKVVYQNLREIQVTAPDPADPVSP